MTASFDGVPVTAQLDSHLVHGSSPPPDLLGYPPPRPVGQRQPPSGDRRVLHRPRHHRASRSYAHQPMLAPHQPGLTTEHGKIHQLHLRALLHASRTSAARTAASPAAHLDVHPQRSTGTGINNPEHDHLGQSDQQLAHPRRVNFHRGSPELGDLDTVKFAEPLCRVRDALRPAHFRRAGLLRSTSSATSA